MDSIEERISTAMSDIAKDKSVKIVYVCESGSRA